MVGGGGEVSWRVRGVGWDRGVAQASFCSAFSKRFADYDDIRALFMTEDVAFTTEKVA